MEKTRDVFIKISNQADLFEIRKKLDEKKNVVKSLFKEYESLCIKENAIFDSWKEDLETIQDEINRVTL